MAESLEELQRLAYGRPDDPDAAAQAQRELAARAAPADPLELPSLPRTRTIPTGAAVALLAAALVLGVTATVIAARPTSSLAVFDRQPTARDLEPPELVTQVTREIEGASFTAVEGSMRFMVADGGSDVWAWRNGEGAVCLGLFREDRSFSSCVPVATFEAEGLEMGSAGGLGVGSQTIAVQWGPIGDPVITIGVATNGIPDK